MKKKNLMILALAAFILTIFAICAGVEDCGKAAAPVDIAPTCTDTPTAAPTDTPTLTPTETPTPTNTGTPTPTPTTAVSVGMVGDILLHTRIESDCKQADGTYDYTGIFSHTASVISAYDLALVNQEVIIGGADLGISAYPTFNADFSLSDALTGAGFNVILHATNHALDKGKQGIINCLANWEKYPNAWVTGIYGSQEAADNQILYIEMDGINIAILNFTYGTNGISIPSDMPYCVGPLLTDGNKEKIGALLDTAEENADFVIVCPHWGTEYTISETSVQKNWNTFFYEHGVDLVIGTHPHVIEPIAVTDGSGTTNLSDYTVDENGHRVIPAGTMLTYYSLGNFVNWTGENGDKIYQRMLGGLAGITLSVDEEGEAYILDFDITPVVSHCVTGQNQVTVYFFSDYTEDLVAANEIKYQTSGFTYDNLVKLCDTVWGSLWK